MGEHRKLGFDVWRPKYSAMRARGTDRGVWLAWGLGVVACGGQVARLDGDGADGGGGAAAGGAASTAADPAGGRGTANSAGSGSTGGSGGTSSQNRQVDEWCMPCPALDEEAPSSQCVVWQTACSRPLEVNVLLVIDRSATMGATTAAGGSTKWQALIDGLAVALEERPELVELSVGLLLLPTPEVSAECGGEACCEVSTAGLDVELGPIARTAPEIVATLEATSPGGLTPTAAALELARSYFLEEGLLRLSGDGHVLLVTDGGPDCNPALMCGPEECSLNLDQACPTSDTDCCSLPSDRLRCVDHEATQALIADLAAHGIRTHVVGLPGAEPYADWLDGFAEAGGTYTDSSGDRAFIEVLEGDEGEVLASFFRDSLGPRRGNMSYSCRIKLDEMPPPGALSSIRVALDCEWLPRLESSAGAAGTHQHTDQPNWFVDESTSPPTIDFHSPYCEQVIWGVDRVDIAFPCPD